MFNLKFNNFTFLIAEESAWQFLVRMSRSQLHWLNDGSPQPLQYLARESFL